MSVLAAALSYVLVSLAFEGTLDTLDVFGFVIGFAVGIAVFGELLARRDVEPLDHELRRIYLQN